MCHAIPPAFLAGLILLVSACGNSGAAPGRQASEPTEGASVPVEVVQPARREMLATYSGTATLEAEADADVLAKVEGEVLRILVEEGDRVAAGALLAVLDDRQLALEVSQAQAELAKLERDYRRQIELNERGLVAAGAFEGLRFDLDTLRARHELAELQLSYTRIRAPFAGTVTRRHIRVGNMVQRSAALFRVTQTSPLKAHVFVPERELRRLQPGQPATVQVDAVPQRQYPARVTLVSPIVDPETATFKVTVEVEDAGADLKPGMFARIGIVFERRPEALQVPRVALVETDGERSVFVVQDGVAHQQAVETGLTDGGNVEITSGLQGGEQVVVVGQSGLKDGNRVRVVTLQAAGPQPTVQRR